MADPDRIEVTTRVAVTPEVAFEIFTEEIDVWWRRGPRFRWITDGTGTLRFEPGVGGRLVEIAEDPSVEPHVVGQILAWEPAKRLMFEMRAEANGPDETTTQVEVCFEAAAGGTRVSIEHRGWEKIPADHPVRHGLVGEAFAGMMSNWWGDLMVEIRVLAEKSR